MNKARMLAAAAASLLLLALSACSGGDSKPSASPTAEAATSTAPAATATATVPPIPTLAKTGLQPGDLLAALLIPTDVSTTPAAATALWQLFPDASAAGYNIEPSNPQDKGETAWVYEEWRVPGAKDGDPIRGKLRQSLQLFGDEASAIAAQKSHVDSDKKDYGAVAITGAQIGDESVYLTLKDDGDKDTPFVTTVRFRVGKLVGRVESARATEYDKAESMTTMARALAAKMRAVLDGTIKARPLPENIAKLMPPAAAAIGVGPALAEVTRPAEAFALIVSSGKLHAVRGRLETYGATELGWRAYGVEADHSQRLVATLFPMNNAASAETWVKELINDSTHKNDRMDPGKTGSSSVFVNNGGELYELQFNKGKVAVSVVCENPSDSKKTSAKCEEAVRKLAEAWYASLPE